MNTWNHGFSICCNRGNHGFLNRCVDQENRRFFNKCGDRGNRDFFNRRGNYNFEFFNPVRNGRSFQDGTFEGLGGVGVNNLEYSRSGDSRYFVHNPTVRRRGVLGSKHVMLGPPLVLG